MMNLLQATLLGIVEGLTEFIPVSSTFHLIWTAKLLGIEHTPFQKLFEIAIQSGAILAVFVQFMRTAKHNIPLIKKVAIAFVPTAVLGFLLYSIIKHIFLENASLQLGMFIAVGVVFILFEKFVQHPYTRDISAITYKEAFIVGMAQAVAVVPGVSRSGAVILALMALSVKREDAATFSFLLAVPTILAASILDIAKSHTVITSKEEALLFLVGFFVAFIVSLGIVRLFITYLKHNTISIFGWYRIAIGLLLLMFV